jgi:hypothetical protein
MKTYIFRPVQSEWPDLQRSSTTVEVTYDDPPPPSKRNIFITTIIIQSRNGSVEKLSSE